MVNDSSLIQNIDFSDYPVLVRHNIPVTHDFIIHQQVLRELLKWNLKIRNQRLLRVSNWNGSISNLVAVLRSKDIN